MLILKLRAGKGSFYVTTIRTFSLGSQRSVRVVRQHAKIAHQPRGVRILGRLAHMLQRAWVGDMRAARMAGSNPAMAPMRTADASPPAHASVGMTTLQCLLWA